MSDFDAQVFELDRRGFIRGGTLFLLGASVGSAAPDMLYGKQRNADPRLRVGLVTDLHYADKPPAGSRHYRESLAKLSEAAELYRKDKPSFVVELGDFIDAAESVETEMSYLRRIEQDFSALSDHRHHVLGNHCVYTLTKDEFLGGVGQKKSYYSFDEGGFHFIVLDSCFRGDGEPYGRRNFKWTDPNIPAQEVEWLRSDLKASQGSSIVFAHQRLDVSGDYGVKNAKEVRKVLEDSGKVVAVFQGHSHKNDYHEISGIHYCTLVAMVEGSGEANNGYSTMDIFEDATIRVRGFRKQNGYTWS